MTETLQTVSDEQILELACNEWDIRDKELIAFARAVLELAGPKWELRMLTDEEIRHIVTGFSSTHEWEIAREAQRKLIEVNADTLRDAGVTVKGV